MWWKIFLSGCHSTSLYTLNITAVCHYWNTTNAHCFRVSANRFYASLSPNKELKTKFLLFLWANATVFVSLSNSKLSLNSNENSNWHKRTGVCQPPSLKMSLRLFFRRQDTQSIYPHQLHGYAQQRLRSSKVYYAGRVRLTSARRPVFRLQRALALPFREVDYLF